MSFKQFFSALLAMLHAVGLTFAGSIDLHASHSTPVGAPAGFTVNDLTVDFTNILRGQQMIVSLTSGSIYIFVPPIDPIIIPAPDPIGFSNSNPFGSSVGFGNQPGLIVGGAVSLQPGATKLFDATGINVAWAPGTGVDVPPQSGLMTARVTLSGTANGAWSYFSSTADGTVRTWLNRPIIDGVMMIPEPSSVTLLGLASLGLMGFVRRPG